MLQREGLITCPERDNGARRGSDKIPALMRKDSFSEQAALSIDESIRELQGGGWAGGVVGVFVYLVLKLLVHLSFFVITTSRHNLIS